MTGRFQIWNNFKNLCNSDPKSGIRSPLQGFLRRKLDCFSQACLYASKCMLSRMKSGICAALLLSLPLALRSFAGDAGTDRGDLRPPAPIRQLSPTYKIQAGIDGEIYPVFANYASLQRQGDRTFGVVSVTLSNTSAESMFRRISVRIPGGSDEEIQPCELAPAATKT